MPEAIAGWTAFALVPAAALAGRILRRGRGAFVVRLRPHFVIGYVTLALATLHALLSMGAADGANMSGIWLATFALVALALQAFLGTNLQSPGMYRPLLRRWHVLTFWGTIVLVAGHVLFNGAFIASVMGRQ